MYPNLQHTRNKWKLSCTITLLWHIVQQFCLKQEFSKQSIIDIVYPIILWMQSCLGLSMLFSSLLDLYPTFTQSRLPKIFPDTAKCPQRWQNHCFIKTYNYSEFFFLGICPTDANTNVICTQWITTVLFIAQEQK